MCCAEFLAKYILFFSNLVFSLAGLTLLGLGIAVLVNITEILEIIPVDINGIPITLIVVGSVVFLIAFFGCCGAIKESRCLLIMYAICMAILAAIKIALAVILYRNLSDIREEVEKWVVDAFERRFDNEEVFVAFNFLQLTFECCGTTGPSSYGIQPLPASCCGDDTPTNQCLATNAYTDGCTVQLGDYFETYGNAVGAIIIAVIVVELVALILGAYLANRVKNNRRQTA